MHVLELKFPNESFDAVHAAQLIEHFAPVETVCFLSKASRALRPGGIVYLTTPGVRNVRNTLSQVCPYPQLHFASC